MDVFVEMMSKILQDIEDINEDKLNDKSSAKKIIIRNDVAKKRKKLGKVKDLWEQMDEGFHA